MSVYCMIGKLCDNKIVIMHSLRWLCVAYRFYTRKITTVFHPLLAKS